MIRAVRPLTQPKPGPLLYDDLSDEALVAQCRAGRQAAWSTLVRRFQRLVYTVPRRAGLSDEQAADVFQASFARLFEHLDRLQDGSRVRAWLVTTARRETLRLIDESRRIVDLSPAGGEDDDGDDPLARFADPAPLPDALLAELQEHDRLRTALDRIDPRARRFLELLFLQDEALPYAEVARRLGIAEGSIGPTRARALEKLRAALAAL
jgi:RNA polymerase sigma factor (sigma-70 family)